MTEQNFNKLSIRFPRYSVFPTQPDEPSIHQTLDREQTQVIETIKIERQTLKAVLNMLKR
jgi:hypothetical protein